MKCLPFIVASCLAIRAGSGKEEEGGFQKAILFFYYFRIDMIRMALYVHTIHTYKPGGGGDDAAANFFFPPCRSRLQSGAVRANKKKV